jgi:hypothetical protein
MTVGETLLAICWCNYPAGNSYLRVPLAVAMLRRARYVPLDWFKFLLRIAADYCYFRMDVKAFGASKLRISTYE